MALSLPVIIGLPHWTISGPHIFAANLARGLRSAGVEAHLLFTETDSELVTETTVKTPLPEDAPHAFLPAGRHDSWGRRWESLIRYLEERAPCVYLMLHDWRMNVVAPRLSDRVRLVGLVQCDSAIEYDQAARLGRYWNAVVAVSEPIHHHLLAHAPHLAPRLLTIPNAVPTLDAAPAKNSGGPLRIAYSGALRREQKRLDDVVSVIAGLAERGVSFHFKFLGDGPLRPELEAATQHWQERGLVTFAGYLQQTELLDELAQTDALVLASDSEGLSIALLEAMSRGCVPVVSDIPTNTAVVRNGENGFAVPVGAVADFVERLALLACDTTLRQRLSQAAWQTIQDGGYSQSNQISAYLKLLERIANNPRFQRPRGAMSAPPERVGGADIMPGNHKFYTDYINGLALWPNPPAKSAPAAPRRHAPPVRPLNDYQVIFTTPSGYISGVDIFAAHLVKGLNANDIRAHILRTKPQSAEISLLNLDLPGDVPTDILPLPTGCPWPVRWQTLIDYLEARAPCFFVPNYDWQFAYAMPRLSPLVKTLGIAHSDEPTHYAPLSQLHQYWDGVAGVSSAITNHLAKLAPDLVPRLHTIPYGVELPPALPPRSEGRFRVIYAGRLVEEQKRVTDLARIAKALTALGIDFELAVIGDGPERGRLTAEGLDEILARRLWLPGKLSNEQVLRLMRESHAVVLPSSFEGLPVVILEAMAQGLVPVATDIRSGLPELIRDGENGFIVPLGDTEGFADRLATLALNRSRLAQMSAAAYRTISVDGYTVEKMVERYQTLFQSIADNPAPRPRGPIVPPPELRGKVKTSIMLRYHTGRLWHRLNKRFSLRKDS